MRTVTAAQGQRADFLGLKNRFVLRSEQTQGRFALVEHSLAPRTLAGPTHTHANEDEYSFVLDGEIGVLIGDEVLTAGPGDLVLKPRGVPHAFWNATDAEARVLELISPGGFEEYFAEIAPLLSGEPDLEGLAAVQTRYGLTMDFSSVGTLSERFGLRA